MVYEVDQTGVLDFKGDVLTRQGATAAAGGARRVEVRVDLRHDWPGALGWTLTGATAIELAESYGRPLDPALATLHGAVRLLDARR